MTTPFPVMPFCHTGITCRSSLGSEDDVRVSCWKTDPEIQAEASLGERSYRTWEKGQRGKVFLIALLTFVEIHYWMFGLSFVRAGVRP